MNAAIMEINRIITPEIHTICSFMGELKYTPRAMWVYIKRKNTEAPFMCAYRIIHPHLVSRMM
jgi:hypothetical protein